MMDAFGDRQQELLHLLLKKKDGLTVEDLAEALKITRTAVRQHLSALERSGYVGRGNFQATGGRPGQVFQLTRKGYELFPKQYSWFSEVLLDAIREEKGSDGLKEFMRQLGETVSAGLASRTSAKAVPERIEETARIMNELAFQAESKGDGGALPAIEATNCVYHALAEKYPEVCQFDLALLSKLTEARVIHEKCILRGGGVCRFRFEKTNKGK